MFFTYTYFIVLLGTFLIGIIAGAVGVFVYYRRESLISDVLGHAALPGIILVFMLTLIKDSSFLTLGAIFSGLLAFFTYRFIYRYTPLNHDAVLGSTLAFFSGLGITLLTYIQSNPDSSQAGLWNYIFGNASNMLYQDVILISGVGAVIFLFLAFFYKELKVITFDLTLAENLNLPIKKLDWTLSLTIGATIMIGIPSVGVILMSSLVVAPVATVKLWVNKFSQVIFWSGIIGGGYSLIGTGLSIYFFQIPVGPLIVVIASLGFLISLITKLAIPSMKLSS